MTLENCKIYNNIADLDGGGIFGQFYVSSLTVKDSEIVNNMADMDKTDDSTGHGDGIFYYTGYNRCCWDIT